MYRLFHKNYRSNSANIMKQKSRGTRIVKKTYELPLRIIRALLQLAGHLL